MAKAGRTRIEQEVDRLGSLVKDISIQVDAIRKRISDLEKFGVRHIHEVKPAGKGKNRHTHGIKPAGKGKGGKARRARVGK
jgi:hypothetical protein